MSRYTRDYGSSDKHILLRSACPVTHVIVEKHLHGIPRDGAFPKKTYYGWSKRTTRGYYSHDWDEDASRGSTQTRGYKPRPGLMQKMRFGMHVARTKEGPLRTMP